MYECERGEKPRKSSVEFLPIRRFSVHLQCIWGSVAPRELSLPPPKKVKCDNRIWMWGGSKTPTRGEGVT